MTSRSNPLYVVRDVDDPEEGYRLEVLVGTPLHWLPVEEAHHEDPIPFGTVGDARRFLRQRPPGWWLATLPAGTAVPVGRWRCLSHHTIYGRPENPHDRRRTKRS